MIPLSNTTIAYTPNPFSLMTAVPVRRLDLYAGRFSMADFIDENSYGSDSHRQFMNWTVDNNGAFDYAADTRGYTMGAVIKYSDTWGGVRFAEALMPTEPNGINLDWNLAQSHSEMLEVKLRHQIFFGHPGIVRILGYMNHADMGSYQQSIDSYLAGNGTVPNIIAVQKQGTIKYGFGLNLEQEVIDGIGVFARLGWNDGNTESYAYTEVDNTVAFGGIAYGRFWKRPLDRVGLAFVTNGISSAPARYLQLGGLGFLLGDGGLSYQRENILESFYTVQIYNGLSFGPDAQLIVNPGYNSVRGPVWVVSGRIHVDI
jgi:carbohydrate-selective porin OprB